MHWENKQPTVRQHVEDECRRFKWVTKAKHVGMRGAVSQMDLHSRASHNKHQRKKTVVVERWREAIQDVFTTQYQQIAWGESNSVRTKKKSHWRFQKQTKSPYWVQHFGSTCCLLGEDPGTALHCTVVFVVGDWWSGWCPSLGRFLQPDSVVRHAPVLPRSEGTVKANCEFAGRHADSERRTRSVCSHHCDDETWTVTHPHNMVKHI